jgi:hypothetical protein
MPFPLLWLSLPALLFAADWQVTPFSLPAAITGATTGPGVLWAWGDGLWARREQRWQRIAGGRFAAPGCLFENHIVLQQDADLIAITHDGRRRTRIDTDAFLSDCLAATLHGRPGLLVVHRGLQVRFYERGQPRQPRWPYREIYSFYTASYQAGLLLADVNGDRLPDLYCGNYWIQAPQRFELPWRLFAINTHHESPPAARFRLAPRGPTLIASQGWMDDGKVMIFHPPSDIHQLWREQRLSDGWNLTQPRGLVVADLDRNGSDEIYIGEAAGEGRVIEWQADGPGIKIGAGLPITAMLPFDWDRDGQRDLVVLGERTGVWYRRQPLK